MAAKDAGVDITNEKEMRKFIALYNMQQLAKLERDKSKTSQTKSKEEMILAPAVAVIRSIKNAVVDDIVINSKIRLGTSDNRAYPTSLTLHPNSSLRLELQIRSDRQATSFK